MIELGRLRREDFKVVTSKTPDDDIVQTITSKSRKFQYPVVFLMKASGTNTVLTFFKQL